MYPKDCPFPPLTGRFSMLMGFSDLIGCTQKRWRGGRLRRSGVTDRLCLGAGTWGGSRGLAGVSTLTSHCTKPTALQSVGVEGGTKGCAPAKCSPQAGDARHSLGPLEEAPPVPLPLTFLSEAGGRNGSQGHPLFLRGFCFSPLHTLA